MGVCRVAQNENPGEQGHGANPQPTELPSMEDLTMMKTMDVSLGL